MSEKILNSRISRRKFLKGVGAAAGTVALASPWTQLTGLASSDKVLKVALWQEPEGLNPFFFIQIASRLVRKRILEGLFRVDPDGTPVPVLAAEIPTLANGGISADGKTITIKLRDGVKWSDGAPLTSQDVVFTWQVVMDPANPVSSTGGYDLIEAIDTPDDTTVVLRFKEIFAPFLTLFSAAGNDAVLPRHVFGGDTDLSQSEFNRMPLGTGPFIITDFTSGTSITLERNPNYRVAGKPVLDKIIYAIVPSREVAIEQVRIGQVDAMWNLLEPQIPLFPAGNPDGVKLVVTNSADLEYLGLNTTNPILSDPAVRKAVGLAIDKQTLVDVILSGQTTVGVSPLSPFHWANDPSLGPVPFDPAQARQVLDDAGWKPGPGSIRVKDGVRLDLEITTTTGSQVRLQNEQVIQQNLQGVGINLAIRNVPSAVLFSGDGPLVQGTYEIAEDTWGPDFDPADFLTILFHPNSIPKWNFFRITEELAPGLGAAIDRGNSTLDLDERRAAYQEAQRLIMATGAYIPLYNRAKIDAFRENVKGVTEGGNPWDDFGWDAENWDV